MIKALGFDNQGILIDAFTHNSTKSVHVVQVIKL